MNFSAKNPYWPNFCLRNRRKTKMEENRKNNKPQKSEVEEEETRVEGKQMRGVFSKSNPRK
uniref:Uncharacterized protein n=1 Tax=Cucumis melo TaxID=3656 RepID=A0A9I9ELM0_CUCME